jgi:hypothetical protein
MAETKNGNVKAGDTPAFDVRETPEFKAAMESVKAKAFDDAKRLFDANRENLNSGAPTMELLEAFSRMIAMSNAEIADQGTMRKRVSPAVLEAQRKSRDQLLELVEAAQTLTGKHRPLYRLRAKAYLGDRLYEPYQRGHRGEVTPTHIYFTSIPNLAMEPLNDAAKEIHAAFVGTMAGVDNMLGGKPVPDALGNKPLWMSKNGAVLAVLTATAREHGMVMDTEPVDVNLSHTPDTTNPLKPGMVELTSVDDPRATHIPVLGTIHPPAVRGTSSPRLA